MKGFIIPPIVSPICPVSEKSQREELFVNSIGAILLNNKRIPAIIIHNTDNLVQSLSLDFVFIFIPN